jgi:uncharacterized repeat protein (TIGR04138 family)
MQKIGFAEALDSIVATDNRYSRKAYVFLRDALDYTTKQQKKTKGAAGQTAKKAGFASATCRKRQAKPLINYDHLQGGTVLIPFSTLNK